MTYETDNDEFIRQVQAAHDAAQAVAPAAPVLPDALRPVGADFTFMQEADCCGGGDDDQLLTVKVEDGGGGPFLVIETARWALDPEGIDALAARLRWCLAQCRSMFDDEPKEATR